MNTHIPVLLKEVLTVLNPQKEGTYLDGTFGGGGHTRAILEAITHSKKDDSSIDSQGLVIALDTDPEAIHRAQELKKDYPNKFVFYDMNFRDLNNIPNNNFSGILFDLGVSSFQLDDGDRGFSFRFDAPVDMRLDPRKGLSAADFLETASTEELVKAIREYGEEKHWKRVVNAIIRSRGTGILKNSLSFSKLIEEALKPTIQHGKKMIHPATKTFQGIRIAINGELEAIESMLPVAFRKLAVGGVLAVISFHSLEDRIIKRFFRKMAGMSEHAQDNTPQQLKKKWGHLLTKKSITASEEEIAANPRSRSARLRAIIKEKDLHEKF